MIQCSSCGKPIEKVPDWLKDTQVNFVCNNCPNRQAKSIAFLTLETDTPAVAKLADEEEEEVEADVEATDDDIVPEDLPEEEVEP